MDYSCTQLAAVPSSIKEQPMTTMSIGVKRDELLQDGNVALGERGIKKRVRLKSYSLSRDEPMTRFELVTSSLPSKRFPYYTFN